MRRATRQGHGPACRPAISIHALLAESDWFIPSLCMTIIYFYPRSPCGERPIASSVVLSNTIFLSTLSLRRATKGFKPYRSTAEISIHALLAESDVHTDIFFVAQNDFYPRSPCGERLIFSSPVSISKKFLSTLSLRRATFSVRSVVLHFRISIHALLAESDKQVESAKKKEILFLSTLSLRRATNQMGAGNRRRGNFYPRSPCGERLASP